MIRRHITTGLLVLVFVLTACVPAARGEAFIPYGEPDRLAFDRGDRDQAAVKAKDGSFFLLSPVEGNVSGDYRLKVMKVDKSGKILWRKALPAKSGQIVGLFHPTGDGGLLLSLQGDRSGPAEKARLMKLDSKGASAWEREFPGEAVNAVNECNDKGYILVGHELKARGQAIKVLKIDQNGKSGGRDVHGFEKSFAEADSQGAAYVCQVLDEDDYNDGYIVAGYTREGSVSRAYLLRLDPYGEKKWAKEYKGSGNAELTFVMPILGDDDEIDGFAAVGRNNYPGKNSQIYLLHTDSFGNKSIWPDRETADSGLGEMSFGSEGHDLMGLALYQVPDEFKDERKRNGKDIEGMGGYMLVGLGLNPQGEHYLRLLRLSEFGRVKLEDDVVIKGQSLLPGRSGQDKDYVELLHGLTVSETGNGERLEYATLKLYLKGDQDDDKTRPAANESNFEAMIWIVDSILMADGQDYITDLEELLATTPFPPVSPGVYSSAKGSIVWPDTSAYLGELRFGKADGSGSLVFPDGTRYNGAWRNNMFWGQGELIFPSGECYQGSFEEHMMQGQGTYTWPGGEAYSGQFMNGKRDGQGTFTWPGGIGYQGQFVKDKPEGSGCITWPNGESYVGSMKGGNATGWGTYCFPSGDYYEGEFNNLVFSGLGRFYWSNGSVYVGEFKNDCLNGEGVFAWPNGVQQRGYWKDNRYMGTNPNSMD
jgi:hypothetical protein